jgi:hypothetical protein
MDEDGIPEVLKTERMGHEIPGVHGVYGHVSPAMRAELRAALQERWEASLCERARLSPRSSVPVLDRLLAAQREAKPRSAPISLPKSDMGGGEPEVRDLRKPLACQFKGGAEGIRTPDPLDTNRGHGSADGLVMHVRPGQ